MTTRVAVLTPPGTGAIATVAVAGPGAWDAARTRFRPAGPTPLPDAPEPGRFWFGKLGDGAADEVVVAVTQTDPEPRVEVHCHGGRRVVRWVVEQFTAAGCEEVSGWKLLTPEDFGDGTDPRVLEPLSRAPTVRTASVLLDQYHGAFARTVADILDALGQGCQHQRVAALAMLAALADLGRHLTEPWTVAVVGPPNVGKSSLINALAGYQRSAVAPVAGTTLDVVTVSVALDGWPVTLSDTAGLRDAPDALEAAGVELARSAAGTADLVVWVLDRSAPEPVLPPPDGPPRLLVANKADLPPAWEPSAAGGDLTLVSAATGAGVPELAAAIARRLVPAAPPPGAAVPFTPPLCDAVIAAWRSFQRGDFATARLSLFPCLPRT